MNTTIEGLDSYLEGTGYGQQVDPCRFCNYDRLECDGKCREVTNADEIYSRLEANKKGDGV